MMPSADVMWLYFRCDRSAALPDADGSELLLVLQSRLLLFQPLLVQLAR